MKQWTDLYLYPEYEISQTGKVRRKKGITLKCLTWSINKRTGYASIQPFNKGKRGKRISIHVAILESFGKPRPKGKVANHKDGNKLKNFFSNLEWVTPQENSLHALKLGLINHRKGDRCYLSKLKSAEVWLIRKLLTNKVKQKLIAKIFKISPSNISYINHNLTWKES